eukprot:423954_1
MYNEHQSGSYTLVEIYSAPNENLSGIIRLNVGGRNSMMGGQNGEPGNKEIFIDRNGLRFGTVLDYMRDRRLPSFKHAWQYEEILMEAKFFQLDGLVTLCENLIKELTEKKNESTRSAVMEIIAAYKSMEMSYKTSCRLRGRSCNIPTLSQEQQTVQCGLRKGSRNGKCIFSLGPEAFTTPDFC